MISGTTGPSVVVNMSFKQLVFLQWLDIAGTMQLTVGKLEPSSACCALQDRASAV
jgi:hypothetical protein